MPITVGNLGRLHSVSRRGADVGFSFASSDLVLTPLLPNLVRHTWVPTHWRAVRGTHDGRLCGSSPRVASRSVREDRRKRRDRVLQSGRTAGRGHARSVSSPVLHRRRAGIPRRSQGGEAYAGPTAIIIPADVSNCSRTIRLISPATIQATYSCCQGGELLERRYLGCHAGTA